MKDTHSPRKRILLTEAYSARNLGDLELVRASAKICRQSFPTEVVEICCAAADVKSFAGRVEEVDTWMPRMFERFDYVSGSRKYRLLLAARWLLRVTLLSVLRCVPGGPLVLGRFAWLLHPTQKAYLNADRVVAVGGGYLGDRYFKETILVCWTWWWASGFTRVETMPMSYEVTNRYLARFVSMTTRRVDFRFRDTESLERASGQGISGHFVPDLAFLNSVPTEAFDDFLEAAPILSIAPVGDDYLTKDTQASLFSSITNAIPRDSDFSIQLIVMHDQIDSTQVGGDHDAATALRDALEADGLKSEIVSVVSYADLINKLRSSRFVLSARMHAGIAGLCAGVPVALIAYERKHYALFRDLGLSSFVLEPTANSSVIADVFNELMQIDRSTVRLATEGHAELVRREFGGPSD